MTIRDEILVKVATDLLSIPPLIFRGTRKKLIKSALEEKNIDISPLHLEIIRLLEEEGTLYVGEIGERLQIAKAQMTQLIDKLETLNMVERKTDSSDRRIVNISLTGQGKDVLEEHKNCVVNAIREALSSLTDEELEDLSYSLRKLQSILSRLQ